MTLKFFKNKITAEIILKLEQKQKFCCGDIHSQN